MTEPKSVTHLHLLNCILTTAPPSGKTLRVLDAGCGNGNLLGYLYQNLPSLCPDTQFEFYGFDLIAGSVQAEGFFQDTLDHLDSVDAAYPWSEKLKSIREGEAWPFDAEFFDYVVSNQVLEHVRDPDRFFLETCRVLKESASAIHLFPVREVILDGHIFLPLVHRFYEWDALRRFITSLTRLGFGAYRKEHGQGVERWSIRHTDYIMFLTHYAFTKDYKKLAKKHRLRFGLDLTFGFYLSKIRQLIGDTQPRRYGLTQRNIGRLLYFLLKRVSSITILLVKKNDYLRMSSTD